MTPIRGDGLIRAVADHALESAEQYEREAEELAREQAELLEKARTLRTLHTLASQHMVGRSVRLVPCGDAA